MKAQQEILGYAKVPRRRRRPSVTKLARLEVALKRLADEKQMDAMAVNCWPQVQERYSISVCSVLGRLTDQGYPCACEVDVYGAASLLATHRRRPGQSRRRTSLTGPSCTRPRRTSGSPGTAATRPTACAGRGCEACICPPSILQFPAYGMLEFTSSPAR